ncbi:MAG: restriction endonuclease subunit S [Nitrospiraceae bacterium]
MSKWPLKRLKDITSKIGSGATPRGGKNGYKVEGITFIRSLNIYDFSFTEEGLAHIDDEQAAELDNVTVQKDDILLNITGASVARCCLANPRFLPARVNQHVAIVRVRPEVADPRFVMYCINSPHYKSRLLALAQGGATREALTKTTIEDFEAPHPPLSVQRRIGAILSAYDELIENNQRRIKILEEMARSLYREWFVHFRFPGHDKVKMVPSSLGPIPQGWEVKPLGALATVTMGLSPKGDTYNEDENGTPLVNGPVEFGDRFTKRVKWTTEPTKFCKEGDLVVCVRGSTTGKYVKSDGMYCLGRGVCGISSKYQCFIERLFENQLPTLLGQTSGSTFPSWTGPQLKSHPVPSPPLEVLARFDALVKPMSAAVLGYSRQIQNLRRTRDLLHPRLLLGQLTETIS